MRKEKGSKIKKVSDGFREMMQRHGNNVTVQCSGVSLFSCTSVISFVVHTLLH